MKDSELATIRTAYRYVVAYERRVLDILRRLNDELSARQFDFLYWSPTLDMDEVDAPRLMPHRDKFPGDRWAWDNVPLYLAELWWFRGVGDTDNRAGNTWLWIEHVADTGFENALGKRRTTLNGEPDALDGSLSPADTTDSLLRVRWALIKAPLPEKQWDMYWPQLVKARFECEAREVFPLKPTTAPSTRSDTCLAAGGHTVSLEALRGPSDVGSMLIEPVVDALEAAGKNM